MTLYLNSNKSENQVTWNKTDYLLAAASRLGLDNVIKFQPGRDEERAEYVLNVEPFIQFRKGSKWTGIWEIDCMFDRPEMKIDDWIASDDVFLANTFYPSRMNAYQGRKTFLFQACDPVLDRRMPEIPKEYDFVFSGSLGIETYISREQAMAKLKQEGFTFHDFGKEHPPEKYVSYLNHARVQFIRSASKLLIGTSQVEQRFFECLAIGPVLKDYHPALETLGLVDGEDLFWYKNDEEMLERMHYLIDNPDFAEEMAENGRKKALLYHTYEHRLVTIFHFINEHISRTA